MRLSLLSGACPQSLPIYLFGYARLTYAHPSPPTYAHTRTPGDAVRGHAAPADCARMAAKVKAALKVRAGDRARRGSLVLAIHV